MFQKKKKKKLQTYNTTVTEVGAAITTVLVATSELTLLSGFMLLRFGPSHRRFQNAGWAFRIPHTPHACSSL